MGHPSKSTALKDLQNERPEILLIQETKQNQNEMQKIVGAHQNFSGASSSSRGASGGITTMWNNQYWDCKSTIFNQNWLRINLNSKEKNCDLIIYNVYIPNHYREKEQCWKELRENIDNEQNPNIILAGDFNLILHANEKRGGNFTHDPFRSHLEGIMYNPLWRNNASAEEIIEATWKQHVEGSPSHIWETKIRSIRKALKEWAKISYQEPENVKKQIQQDLEEVQKQIEDQGLTHQLKNKEWEIQGQLMHIKREEEIKWRFKSRQLWLKEGDKNTTYFHKQATARKIRNNVNAITDSKGNQHNNQEDIKRAASLHFKSLLTEDQEEIDYSELLQYLPKGITPGMNESLNREIEEEEIRKAIWPLQLDKSLGPDGFPINFYRDHWQLIRKDLAKMLRGIQRKGKMGGFTNSTFLALIPKENRPSTFSRFRPISL
eukprot:PITA_16434